LQIVRRPSGRLRSDQQIEWIEQALGGSLR
jgi:hypothetical protein